MLCHPIKSSAANSTLSRLLTLYRGPVVALSRFFANYATKPTVYWPAASVFAHGQSIIDGTIQGKNEDDVTSPTVTQWTATVVLCRVPSKTVSPKQLIIQNINRGVIIAISWLISVTVKEIKARTWNNFDSHFALKHTAVPLNRPFSKMAAKNSN